MKKSLKKPFLSVLITSTVIFGAFSFYSININNAKYSANQGSLSEQAYSNVKEMPSDGEIKDISNSGTNQFVIFEDHNGIDHLFAAGTNTSFVISNDGNEDDIFWEYNEIDLDDDGESGYSNGFLNNVSTNGSTVLLSTTDNDNVDHLYSWGFNDYGQTGTGTEGYNLVINPKEVDLEGDGQSGYNGTINDISMGLKHGVVSTTDDSGNDHIYTFGGDTYGELGDTNGSSTNREYSPIEISLDLTGKKVKQVDAGEHNSLAIVNDGSGDKIYGWGENDLGQLGIGTNQQSIRTPQQVTSTWGENAVINDIDTNGFTSSAVVNDEVYIWGDNSNHQINYNNNTSYYNSPQTIAELQFKGYQYINVESTSSSSMAIAKKENKYSVITWGTNYKGTLGIGNNDENYFKTGVNEDIAFEGIEISEIKNLSASTNSVSVVINDGTNDYLYSWGSNEYGQIGAGQDNKNIVTSPLVSNFTPYNGDIEIESALADNDSVDSDSASINYSLSVNETKETGMDPFVKSVTVIGFENQEQATTVTDGEMSGTIELTNLTLETLYDSLELQVIYSGASGIDQTVTKTVDSFYSSATFINDIEVDSTSVDVVNPDSATISYNLAQTSTYKKDAVVKSVTITGFSGQETSETITDGEMTGLIHISNLTENTTYSELQLEVTYDGVSGVDQKTYGDIESFTTDSNFVNDIRIQSTEITSYDSNSASIDYTLTTTSSNLKANAIITSVTVVGFYYDEQATTVTDGEMTGTIELTNLKDNYVYNNLKLQVTYIGKTGNGAEQTINSDIETFTTPPEYANDISIEDIEVTNIKWHSATIEYHLERTDDSLKTTDAQVKSVTVIGFNDQLKGESTTVTDGKLDGEITLTNLDDDFTYSGLELQVTYIGKSTANQEIAATRTISEFTTIFDSMPHSKLVIWILILLILIEVITLLIIWGLLIFKKFW